MFSSLRIQYPLELIELDALQIYVLTHANFSHNLKITRKGTRSGFPHTLLFLHFHLFTQMEMEMWLCCAIEFGCAQLGEEILS